MTGMEHGTPGRPRPTGEGRDETETERYDRNWIEVLQELRVLQTGTQILTGFLLALAFQPAFSDLTSGQRNFYLFLVVTAAVSAIIALAPVALHRTLFRRRAKRHTVAYGHISLITALVTVSVLVVGVVAFIFDFVLDSRAAALVAVCLASGIVVLWVAVPVGWRFRERAERGRRS
ncbi:DUF6328 family protein [Microbacterium sp. LRZ72]|uniref:DUF6328 family protein n=1 Tax=Microbacterium sp. LRZ72 TaxID=2942481 RepID=UPI0029B87453|nr:DUF6328 family protein [Microbacterium sp. LRZ72]MDX2377935.1 DUF6328 family protein [Microbacterium sp. LRZ72]